MPDTMGAFQISPISRDQMFCLKVVEQIPEFAFALLRSDIILGKQRVVQFVKGPGYLETAPNECRDTVEPEALAFSRVERHEFITYVGFHQIDGTYKFSNHPVSLAGRVPLL